MSLPLIVSAGEALIDLVTAGGNAWNAHPGGAGWNTARACARLGIESAFAGSIGNDNFGDDLFRESLEAGLDPRFLQRVHAPTLMAVVHSKSPPSYRFIGDGSADLMFNPTNLPDGWLGAAEWLHLGGISLSRWPLADTLLGLLEAARAAGTKVSFDPNIRNLHGHPNYPAVFEAVLRRASIVKLSEEDVSFLFAGLSDEQAVSEMRALNEKAPIIITRGEKGSSLYENDTRTDYPSYPVKVVDTVGAGDALCAGILVSATEKPQETWAHHLSFGTKASAIACSKAGAYAPTLAEVHALDSL